MSTLSWTQQYEVRKEERLAEEERNRRNTRRGFSRREGEMGNGRGCDEGELIDPGGNVSKEPTVFPGLGPNSYSLPDKVDKPVTLDPWLDSYNTKKAAALEILDAGQSLPKPKGHVLMTEATGSYISKNIISPGGKKFQKEVKKLVSKQKIRIWEEELTSVKMGKFKVNKTGISAAHSKPAKARLPKPNRAFSSKPPPTPCQLLGQTSFPGRL